MLATYVYYLKLFSLMSAEIDFSYFLINLWFIYFIYFTYFILYKYYCVL